MAIKARYITIKANLTDMDPSPKFEKTVNLITKQSKQIKNSYVILIGFFYFFYFIFLDTNRPIFGRSKMQ